MSGGCCVVVNDGRMIGVGIVGIVWGWLGMIDVEVVGVEVINVMDEVVVVLGVCVNLVV